MFTNFDASAAAYALPLLKALRDANINAEMYPDAAKLKKQLDYADRKHIAFVVLVGSDEMASNTLTVKHMQSGQQYKVERDALAQRLLAMLE
jgi:histidyl-tRNA synthetase